MKLHKFAIAAFALSMTGAMAGGYGDKSKQQQAEGTTPSASAEAQAPAGYADKSSQAQASRPQDTQMAQSQQQGNGSTASSSSSAQPNAPAGYADTSAASSKSSQPKDTQAGQAAQGTGTSASTSGNGSSSTSGSGSSAGSSTIRQAQQALQQKGHDPGQIDGQWGPKTQQAVQGFQQSQGLQSSGQLDQQTLAALGVQGNGSSMSQGSAKSSSDPTSSQLEGTQGFNEKSKKY